MNHTEKLISIIQNDSWMIEVLKIVRELNLNDCWIGAGFIRNKVWDVLHKKERTKLNDIDVIYFDSIKKEKEFDQEIEEKLKKSNPNLNWSVKNQARMHLRNQHNPYLNCLDAMSFWTETATAIAIRINAENQIEIIAPYGLSDLFELKICPSSKGNKQVYKERIAKKNWEKTWTDLKIEKVSF
ncbi:nucleotidyltransferase family protein [Aureivirga marina]|uniref:nucleotidyltransferase family protein n=1 Tax=Aureivirga marina TaxID=1182451 RepID=UPI0018CA4118|nr:nucleotidyltransferase family protein [Aureivirga marina]